MESQPRLLDQMREVLRLKHLSYRTEESYVSWVKRFIVFHGKRHPKDLGVPEIRAFLSYLATHEQVAASTQNSALNALLFLYRSVLTLQRHLPISHFISIRYGIFMSSVLTVFIAITP